MKLRSPRPSTLRTSVNLLRLVALCGLAGCAGREDGARMAARIVHVRGEARADVAPSVHRIEPLELERPAEPEHADPIAASAPSARDVALLETLRAASIAPGARVLSSLPMTVETKLGDGGVARFVVETRRDWAAWSNLLAASRLGVSLGVEAAPETVIRAFDRGALRGRLSAREARRGWPMWEDAASMGASVRGAMFAAPTPEQRLRVDRHAWAYFAAALRQDAPVASTRKPARGPSARVELLRALAPQLSSLLVLDHLVGMRDRWGAEIVAVDPRAPRLLALDLDAALDPRAALDPKRKPGIGLRRVERFSRAVIAAVRRMSKDDLVRAVGVDDAGAHLLDDRTLASVLARRAELLAYVDALIAKYGEDRVLCWE